MELSPTLDRRDATIGCLLALVAAGLYWATWQGWYYNDGSGFVGELAGVEDGGWNLRHLAYVPLGYALEAPAAVNPVLALRLLSCISGAVAAGATFYLGRALGAARSGALVASVAFGVSPAAWFFATTVEIHALHAACAAIAGWIVLGARRGRPMTRALALAAGAVLVYTSHRSGLLLVPGLVLLHQSVRGDRFRAADFVPPLVGASLGLAVAMIASQLAHEGTLGMGIEDSSSFITKHRDPFDWSRMWSEHLWPFGLTLPLAFVGAIQRRREVSLLGALLAIFAPTVAFFVWYGERSLGGYLLGVAPFVAALAASVTLRSAWLPWALVVLQAIGTGLYLRQDEFRDEALIASERASAYDAALLPEGGRVISFDPRRQTVNGRHPLVTEHHRWYLIIEVFAAGGEFQIILDRTLESLDKLLDSPGPPVYLDATHLLEHDDHPAIARGVETLLAELEQRYELREPPTEGLRLRRVVRRK